MSRDDPLFVPRMLTRRCVVIFIYDRYIGRCREREGGELHTVFGEKNLSPQQLVAYYMKYTITPIVSKRHLLVLLFRVGLTGFWAMFHFFEFRYSPRVCIKNYSQVERGGPTERILSSVAEVSLSPQPRSRPNLGSFPSILRNIATPCCRHVTRRNLLSRKRCS